MSSSSSKEKTSDGPQGPASIRKKLEKVRSIPVEWKGNKGFFINKKNLDAMEDTVENLMQDPLESNTEELLELSQEIADLKTQQLIAEEALSTLRSRDAELNEELGKFRAASHIGNDAYNSLKAEMKKETAAKTNLVKELDAAHRKIKERADKTKHGFDLGAATEAQEDLDASKEALRVAKAEVDELRTRARKHEDEKLNREKEIKTLQASRDAVHAELLSVQEKQLMASKPEFFEVTQAKVEIPEGVIKSLLGDKGLNWLKQLDATNRIDIRERAFKMLNVARSGNSVVFKNLGDLVSIVFEWVKNTPYKTRMKIKPWLDTVENDLKAMRLKSMKYYRESLEAIIGKYKKTKVAIEKQHTKYKETHGWYKNMLNIGHKIVNAPASFYQKSVSTLKRAFSSFKSWVSEKWDRMDAYFASVLISQHQRGTHKNTYKSKCPLCVREADPDKFNSIKDWVYSHFPGIKTMDKSEPD